MPTRKAASTTTAACARRRYPPHRLLRLPRIASRHDPRRQKRALEPRKLEGIEVGIRSGAGVGASEMTKLLVSPS